jgi:hypothetical protein
MAIDISIKGEGLSYTTTTSILKASQIIAFLNAGTDMPVDQQSSTKSVQNQPLLLSNTNNNRSPIDVIRESNAKTNMQKILVFAKYHIEKNNGLTFDPQEIKIYFRKTGIGEPRNYGRDIRDAIKLNYIYEEQPGEYVITDYGNKLLESGFEGEVKSKIIKKRQPLVKIASKKISVSRVSEAVSNLEIIPKLDGVISYHDINKKSDRILWILYFASQSSVTELSPLDIEYIADKLIDKIPTSSLSALNEKNRKMAYITKTKEGKFKLLFDGIEYIKNLQKVIDMGSVSNEVEGK